MNNINYQKEVMRSAPDTVELIKHRFNSSLIITTLVHAQLGLTTEVGELADAVKKFLIYGQKLDRENVIEECGDILWYLTLALDTIGSSVDEAMQNNVNKLKLRYPEKFTEKDAAERKDKIRICPICTCDDRKHASHCSVIN